MTTAKKASGSASQTNANTTEPKTAGASGAPAGGPTAGGSASPGSAAELNSGESLSPSASALVLAESSALAMGMIYMAAAQSESLLFENAVHNQALSAAAAQTANLQGIAQLEKITEASSQAALEKLAGANLADQILAKKAAAAG